MLNIPNSSNVADTLQRRGNNKRVHTKEGKKRKSTKE